MDPFVERLAEVCAAHPTAEKWVVLPSVSVGLTVGQRLAGPRLVARGIGRLREEVGPALVGRLLQGPGTVPDSSGSVPC